MSDYSRENCYEKIARIAMDSGLVYKASGGVIVIVHPDTQKEQEIEGICLYMSGLAPHPKSLDLK